MFGLVLLPESVWPVALPTGTWGQCKNESSRPAVFPVHFLGAVSCCIGFTYCQQTGQLAGMKGVNSTLKLTIFLCTFSSHSHPLPSLAFVPWGLVWLLNPSSLCCSQFPWIHYSKFNSAEKLLINLDIPIYSVMKLQKLYELRLGRQVKRYSTFYFLLFTSYISTL